VGERDIAALVVGFGVSVVAVRAVEMLGRRRGLFDVPKVRGMHRLPTPRIGGVGLLVGTAIGTLVGGFPLQPEAAIVLGGGAVLWGAGVVDDLHPLRVWPRLAVQVAVGVAAAVVIAPALLIELPWVSVTIDGWLAVLLATLWIVGAVNALNFIDGTDGMAGWLVIGSVPAAMLLGGASTDTLLLALAGSCAGFLVWNHHPASIFMGDGGSQFLGYSIATVLLAGIAGPVPAVPIVLALAPLILDTGTTVATRIALGVNPLTPHDTHLYQRLARAGVNQRAIAVGYAVATVACGWAAITYGSADDAVQYGILGAFGLAAVATAIASRRLRDHRPDLCPGHSEMPGA